MAINIEHIETLSKQEVRELYGEAKDKYYNTDSPIMSDAEFDELEEYLMTSDPEGFAKYVGSENEKGEKAEHWNKMLSLAKTKVNEEGFLHSHLFDISKHLPVAVRWRASWKFDGLAINLQYWNGMLSKIITRGDGKKGVDITAKFRCRVPQTINTNEAIEIRCEGVMTKANFNKPEYEKYAHARNLVSGIKNNLDVDDKRVSDVDFVVVDGITKLGKILDVWTISQMSPDFIIGENFQWHNTLSDVEHYYNQMARRREEFEYTNDGIVIFAEMPGTTRVHNGHDPDDAIAIKFPPKKAITTVKSIEWKLSKHGKYIPVVILVPVVIDGRTIRRVTGFNYGFIKEKGIFVGTTLEIAIKGDIIPGIVRVVEKGTGNRVIPNDSRIDGVHLMATNVEWKLARKRFIGGVLSMGFDGFGSKTISKLWDAIEHQLGEDNFTYDEIFKDYITTAFVLNSGMGSKTSTSFIEQRQNIMTSGVKLRTIIRALGLTGLGRTMSKQVANHMAGIEYSYDGLEKSIVKSVTIPGERYWTILHHVLDSLHTSNVHILVPTFEPPVDTSSMQDIKFYIMTGSPKPFGHKTKKDFAATLPSNYKEAKNIRHADVLFTDDASANTSKMKTANSLNIDIELYSHAK